MCIRDRLKSIKIFQSYDHYVLPPFYGSQCHKLWSHTAHVRLCIGVRRVWTCLSTKIVWQCETHVSLWYCNRLRCMNMLVVWFSVGDVELVETVEIWTVWTFNWHTYQWTLSHQITDNKSPVSREFKGGNFFETQCESHTKRLELDSVQTLLWILSSKILPMFYQKSLVCLAK